MAEVAEIEPDDFEEIYRKYLKDDDHRLQRGDWQQLFQPVCKSLNNACVGYKLVHDGQVAGMLGMIMSNRIIDGTPLSFCNLHSWFVDEDQRGNSLLLMRPLLRMKEHVITDFSPTPSVVKISKRLGFRTFTIPQRTLVSRSVVGSGKKKGKAPRPELTWDEEINSQILDKADRDIFDDHNRPGFFRLLIRHHKEHAFLVVKRVTFHWRPYASILYSSNPDLMVETQNAWPQSIRQNLSVKRIVGPEKYLPRNVYGSYRIPFPNSFLFRSDQHGSEIIDTLYSEVSMLGLTSLPGAKTIARETMKLLNPISWIRKSKTIDDE